MVETKEIHPVVRSCELAIGVKEQRVACNGLVKQLHGFEQILFCARAKRNAIDESLGTRVGIVGNKVRGRRLFDSGFFGR